VRGGALAATLACTTLLGSGTTRIAPPPTDANWLARAKQAIAAREYRASANREGLQAPNRAHNLRTYFGPTGIRVHDRTAAGSPELLRLTVVGVGRGVEIAGVAPGEPVNAGERRVEIRRPGLVEWYVNSEAGLEQGFTVSERPSGVGPLALEIAAAGARGSLHGSEVWFESGSRKLHYRDLSAKDASKKSIAAHLELASADRLRIVVDDAGASYPIVIDPLLAADASAQLESDQSDSGFGRSVASAGDVNGDGYSDVIVGALAYDAGQSNEGAAFVFLGSATGISDASAASAATQLAAGEADAQFGASVASAGDVNGDVYADVIVGAPASDDTPLFTDSGSAFVFLGSASGIDANLANAARLKSLQTDAQLGSSVATAGDVNHDGYADVIVGAPLYDATPLGANTGVALLFLGSASGIANGNPLTANTRIDSDQAGAQLGYSVATAGDVNGDGAADVIVGADRYDAGEAGEGAAFVFLGSVLGIASGNQGTASARLESDQAYASLGRSVASAGDVNGDGYGDVIVDAQEYDAGQTDEGAVFVFLGSASGIANGNPANAATQLETNSSEGVRVLSSLASAGDVNGDGYSDVVVGAPGYDAGQLDEGAAFLLRGSAAGLVAPGVEPVELESTPGIESNQGSAFLGMSVGAAGDVNDDGFGDVIVGAPKYDSGQTNEGAAFIFNGSATGIGIDLASAAAQLESDKANANFGAGIASAGDVNGDGFGDVIVGSPTYDSYGAAFVFHGSASGIADGNPATAAAQLHSDGDPNYRDVGNNVASAGDVNGDGYGDVIATSFISVPEVGSWTAAYIFHGSATGIADPHPVTTLKLDQDTGLSDRISSAGDLNEDGYGDVVVGAPGYYAGSGPEGAAFVFLGSASGIPSGLPQSAAARLESNQAGARFGWSVAAGDVNGDGHGDLIVGATHYEAGQSYEGAAFVFDGSASGIGNGDPSTASARLESDQAYAEFGSGVAAADMDGDGYDDVIVGAYQYDAEWTNGGAAFVFRGGPSAIGNVNPSAAARVLGPHKAGAGFGASVAAAGDVNADGATDLIVGAPYYSGDEVEEGAAFVYLPEPGFQSSLAGGLLLIAALRRRRSLLSAPARAGG
jgi:hypothetical protein